jgi:hypothetical protein
MRSRATVSPLNRRLALAAGKPRQLRLLDQLAAEPVKPARKRRSAPRRTATPDADPTWWASFVCPSDREWAEFLAANPKYA